MITEIADRVGIHLIESERYRNSDLALLARIWWDDIKRLRYWSDEEIKVIRQFLDLMVSGDLTNFESVRRCRQKLQEENEDMRGELYYKRHDIEDTVRQEIIRW